MQSLVSSTVTAMFYVFCCVVCQLSVCKCDNNLIKEASFWCWILIVFLCCDSDQDLTGMNLQVFF